MNAKLPRTTGGTDWTRSLRSPSHPSHIIWGVGHNMDQGVGLGVSGVSGRENGEEFSLPALLPWRSPGSLVGWRLTGPPQRVSNLGAGALPHQPGTAPPRAKEKCRGRGTPGSSLGLVSLKVGEGAGESCLGGQAPLGVEVVSLADAALGGWEGMKGLGVPGHLTSSSPLSGCSLGPQTWNQSCFGGARPSCSARRT